MFDIIGPPTILHCDNGREFTNNVIAKYLLDNNVKMINGKPRHSKSQGSVEGDNRDIQSLLIAWWEEHQSSSWSKALGDMHYQKKY